MARLLLLLLPALALAGFVFVFVVGLPWLLTNQPYAVPQQPIRFNHRVHVEQVGMECAFCHRTAAIGVTAGMPDVQQCIFCHVAVGQGVPEQEKLRQAWVAQDRIDWMHVHRQPDHVRFVHDAHVQAGLPCATCHGDVGRMEVTVKVRPLNMADCVDCHRVQSAPASCGVCHY